MAETVEHPETKIKKITNMLGVEEHYTKMCFHLAAYNKNIQVKQATLLSVVCYAFFENEPVQIQKP